MIREKVKIDTFVRDQQGRTWLNPDCDQVKGGVLVPQSQAFVIPAAINAGAMGTAPIKILESQSGCYNEILSLTKQFAAGVNADVSARLLVEPRLFDRAQMSICNRPVLVNHVFGTQLNPFYLQSDANDLADAGESILLQDRQYCGFIFYNPSTAGEATLSIIAESTKITNRATEPVKISIDKKIGYKTKIVPYWFTMDQSIQQGVAGIRLAAAQTSQLFFQNKENFTLILTSVMASVITEGTGSSERFMFDLFDPNMDEQLTDQPVSWNCAAGTAGYPFRLRAPLIVDPRRNFRMRITSLNTVGNMDVFITFYGVAVLHEQMGHYEPSGRYIPNLPVVPFERADILD